MTKTKIHPERTAEQVFAEIEAAASKACPELRDNSDIKIGEVIHQGDVYLHAVADTHPRGELLGTRQVAVGNTVGARHIVEGNVKVYAGVKYPNWVKDPEGSQPNAILGPVVVVESEAVLTHPDHAHHTLRVGLYQVTYQYNPRTMRTVQD